MTTAHRPTFHNAFGGGNQGGNYLVAPSTKVSSRDLPGHTRVKLRQVRPPPMYTEDVQFDTVPHRASLKEALEKKEREHNERKEREKVMFGPVEALSDFSTVKEKLFNPVPQMLLPDVEESPFPEDADDYGGTNVETASRRFQKDTDNEDEESESSDDDEEELMRELEKIRKERQQEELKRKQQLDEEEKSEERLRILQANPLIIDGGSLKRRWDDDVVFRNQAKNIPKPKKRFINDTVRSDFHRKFLARYIQ